jgi:uncharacterized membrane protein YdjX (TVP38/TMEM64 family)/Zn-finger nucleic acid-binding protein
LPLDKVQLLRNTTFWKGLAISVLVLALVITAQVAPVESWLERLIVWIEDRGVSGKLIFTGTYIVAMVACLWGTPFTLAAGVAFGLWWGTLIATFSATSGSALAFLIARYLARDTIEKRIQRNRKFQAIDAAIGQKGWTIVFLTRFSPLVPFSISNYFFGLTKIGFWPFVWASFLAILPGSFLVVYLGHLGRLTLLDGWSQLGAWQYLLIGGGLIFTVAIIVCLARISRKALAEAERRTASARETNDENSCLPAADRQPAYNLQATSAPFRSPTAPFHVTKRAGLNEMKCPACSHKLKEIQVATITVDVCDGGCGGLWLDAFELQHVDEEHETAGERLLHIHRDPDRPVDRERKRECPRCPDVKLKRHFFSAKRRVEVDQCPNCAGYWLDAGELVSIRAEKSHASKAQLLRETTVSSDVIRYLYRLQTEGRLRK